MNKLLAAIALAATSSVSLAGGAVDLSLTLESVRLEHEAKIVDTAAMFSVGGAYNEGSGYMISLGGAAVDPTANHELVAGLGGKIFAMSEEGEDLGVGLGIGGFVRYQPDFFHGVGVEMSGFYAPDVLSWANSHAMGEFLTRLSYKVLPNARVFVGYTYIAVDQDFRNREIENSGNIGFRVNY